MAETVRVSLDEGDSAIFAKIKTQIGVKADAEVFRFLMTYYSRQEGIITSSASGIETENTEPKEKEAKAE